MSENNIAQDALDAERLDRAIRLRVRGAHWNEIAKTCGFSTPAAALRAVGQAMAESSQRAEETADQMRDTANLRLEHLLRQTLDMLDDEAPMDLEGNVQDDRAVKLRAVDEARRLTESLAKLNGVATPPKDSETEAIPTIRIVGIDPKDIV